MSHWRKFIAWLSENTATKLLAAAFIVLAWLFRYDMHGASAGAVYVLDRWSGALYYARGPVYVRVKDRE